MDTTVHIYMYMYAVDSGPHMADSSRVPHSSQLATDQEYLMHSSHLAAVRGSKPYQSVHAALMAG